MFVAFIVVALFIVLLFYLLYLYSVKMFMEWVRLCIDWKILRYMLYIVGAAYIIIPHILFIMLVVAIL